jgi:biotin carboxyl carrier protein
VKHRTAVIAGERVEIAWNDSGNAVEATVGGRAYKLETRKLGSGAYWFGWNGRSVEVVVTERDPGWEVSIHGHRIAVEFADSEKTRRRHGSGDSKGVAEVCAPMPGKIVRVLLSEGDAVEPQQGVVVMEAMKMQNEIRAPKGGKILELKVKAGDAVNLGDLIARVE